MIKQYIRMAAPLIFVMVFFGSIMFVILPNALNCNMYNEMTDQEFEELEPKIFDSKSEAFVACESAVESSMILGVIMVIVLPFVFILVLYSKRRKNDITRN